MIISELYITNFQYGSRENTRMKFTEMMDMRPEKFFIKILILAVVVIVFTGSDLIVKEIATRNLRNAPDVVVIPGLWTFHYVVNDDIGFSILNWLNDFLNRTQKWIFLVILQGIGTIIVISFYFYSKSYKYLIPLAFISSGALGNVTDRIMRGHVVDYVKWFYNDFIWPIFNLADVYTVTGAIMLIIVLFFFSKDSD